MSVGKTLFLTGRLVPSSSRQLSAAYGLALGGRRYNSSTTANTPPRTTTPEPKAEAQRQAAAEPSPVQPPHNSSSRSSTPPAATPPSNLKEQPPSPTSLTNNAVLHQYRNLPSSQRLPRAHVPPSQQRPGLPRHLFYQFLAAFTLAPIVMYFYWQHREEHMGAKKERMYREAQERYHRLSAARGGSKQEAAAGLK